MKKWMMFLLATVMTYSSVAQVEVGGAVLPSEETFYGKEVFLNGAGVREKLWIDLYAAGLYLTEKSSDARAILENEKPMAIKLHIVSKLITSDKMVEAVNEGFEKSTDGNTAPIAAEINLLLSFFKEDIHKNDVFDLVYLPSRGLIAYKNGEEKGVIEGKAFKKALFGIWLSENSADSGLKDDLLAK